ncbi:hypothetical protein PybrP1_008705 [[Pythium] brassicae (nom. inval.)]|nr:hypothetical protein PybrP1_008705 [[Pythium] brassicae (nom. inval.)]
MWLYSPTRPRLQQAMPSGTHLLGDLEYTLYPWLLIPFVEHEQQTRLSPDQLRYNKLHSSTRMCAEYAFGRWKGRFRRLQTVMNEKATAKMCAVVAAAAVLHNLFEDLVVPLRTRACWFARSASRAPTRSLQASRIPSASRRARARVLAVDSLRRREGAITATALSCCVSDSYPRKSATSSNPAAQVDDRSGNADMPLRVPHKSCMSAKRSGSAGAALFPVWLRADMYEVYRDLRCFNCADLRIPHPIHAHVFLTKILNTHLALTLLAVDNSANFRADFCRQKIACQTNMLRVASIVEPILHFRVADAQQRIHPPFYPRKMQLYHTLCVDVRAAVV